MPKTYEPIATNTIGIATPTVTFSAIPQTYTDLIIIGQGVGACPEIFVRFNGNTSSLYSNTRLYGNGSTISSDRSSGDTSYFVTTGSFTNGNFVFQLNNYSNSTTFKTGVSRNNTAGAFTALVAGLFRSTDAITSISLNGASANNITVGSNFTLYGIKAA
jgi:hypothetical protein